MTDWLDRPSPAAVEAERALLGGLLQDGVQIVEIARTVEPDDFYYPPHVALYRLLLVMMAGGKPIELLSVAEQIMLGGHEKADRYGGSAYVAELPEHAPSTQNLGYYAERIVTLAQARKLIAATVAGTDDLFEAKGDPTALALALAAKLTDIAARTQVRKVSWTMPEAQDAWVERRLDVEAGAVPDPISTGIPALDAQLTGGGMMPGQLIVVGGRPGMGKTGLALALAVQTARQGRPVLFCSIEQRVEEQHLRALAVEMHLSTEAINELPVDDVPMIDAVARLETLVIHDPAEQSMRTIELEAARWTARFGCLALIVIDYLQLVQHERERGESANVYVGRSSTQAKQLGRKFGCPVVLLSQMNRAVESRAAPRKRDQTEAWWTEVALPVPGDLRDSGQIESDADVILFPVNAVQYGVARGEEDLGAIVVAKQRNGPSGVVSVRWHGECATYRPLSSGGF